MSILTNTIYKNKISNLEFRVLDIFPQRNEIIIIEIGNTIKMPYSILMDEFETGIGYGIPCVYNKVLLLNISFSGLKQPYKNVEFTHLWYVDPKNQTDKNSMRFSSNERGPVNNITLSGEEAANKNRTAQIVTDAEMYLQFPQICNIKRKKVDGNKHITKEILI